MEYFCISVSDSNKETVKNKVKETRVLEHEIFNIPLSSNGQLPITHWFCVMKYDEELCNRLLEMKNLTDMEKTTPKNFLQSRGFKFVNK